MANDQFQKLLRFARRTGDRLIVTDEHGGEPLVILPFEQYEALVNGFLGPDDEEIERVAEQVESEFQAEGEEEIGEIEIDPVFLAAPAESVLEVIEPRPVPLAEPQPPVLPPTRPPEPPRQPLAQAKNNGGEEQFYLEPL